MNTNECAASESRAGSCERKSRDLPVTRDLHDKYATALYICCRYTDVFVFFVL